MSLKLDKGKLIAFNRQDEEEVSMMMLMRMRAKCVLLQGHYLVDEYLSEVELAPVPVISPSCA